MIQTNLNSRVLHDLIHKTFIKYKKKEDLSGHAAKRQQTKTILDIFFNLVLQNETIWNQLDNFYCYISNVFFQEY